MCDACNALNVSRRRLLEGIALAGTGVFAATAPQGVALALDGSADLTDEVKDASGLTEAANVAWYDKLDFEDRSEYENATRNLIAAPDALEICDDTGRVIWSQKAYTFVEGADAPASANPSLWENTRNNPCTACSKSLTASTRCADTTWRTLRLLRARRAGLSSTRS